MTLWQLKAFATVAREGSFTKAGKVLNIAQPSVSALIIDLQKELKVKLFEKLGTRTHLTEAGRRLLQIVERALGMIEKIPEEMEQVTGLKKGQIKVGGSVISAATFLPALVQRFQKEHPGVEVFFKVDRSHILEKNLLDGEIDIAVLGLAPHSSALITEPYREEDIVAIAPPDHPLARKRNVPLELLARHPIVIGDRSGSVVRNMVEKVFAERGLPFTLGLEVNMSSSGRDAIRNCVANGLGVGFISKCLVTGDIQSGRLKALRVPELKLKSTMYIAVHKNRTGSDLIQAFIKALKSS